MHTENRVALLFANALESVLSTFAKATPTAHFGGAKLNIEHGDAASVEPNLQLIAGEVEQTIESAWANIDVGDHVRTVLKRSMTNASTAEIEVAARFLARWPGSDAQTYVNTWTRIP